MMRGSKNSPKRRPPGYGTIETLPSGKIRAIVTINSQRYRGTPAIDPSRFLNRQAAETEAYRLLQQRLDEISANPQSSFTTFASAWLNRRRDELSPSTIDLYEAWNRNLEKDPLGDRPADSITAADLKAYANRYSVAKITLRNRLAWFLQVLNDAGNPVRIDLPRKERSRRRPLTPNERTTLEEAIDPADAELHLMHLLTRQAHLRRSEAAGLKHEDRDGDGIWINRVVLAVKGKLIVREKAKTTRSHDWVALSPELRELIGNGRTGFVLGDGKRPMSPRRITNRIQHVARGLSVPQMGPHALRRTGGMELLENNVDLKTASSQMRHDWKMLMDEYTVTRQDQKLEAIEKTYGKPTPKTHQTKKRA